MNRAISLLACVAVAIVVMPLQGCSSNKSFVKKDASFASELKCIRYETPGILRSTKTETFLLATAAVALPGGTALILISDEYARTRGENMQLKIPDFGNLVMTKFAEKISQEASDWPPVTIDNKPATQERSESCTVIEFKVKRLAYGYLDFIRGGGNGFLSKTEVTMKDPGGDILWQKNFTYVSKDFGRARELDEFEAEDGRLLKEEIDFAAEKTASDFLDHLHGRSM